MTVKAIWTTFLDSKNRRGNRIGGGPVDHLFHVQGDGHGLMGTHVLDQAFQRRSESQVVEQAGPQPECETAHFDQGVFGQMLEAIDAAGAFGGVAASRGGTKARDQQRQGLADSIVQLKNIRFDNPMFSLTTTYNREDFTKLLTAQFGVPAETVKEFFDTARGMNFYDDQRMTTRELFEKFFPGREDIVRLLMEPITYANGSTLEDPAISYGIVFSNFMSKGVFIFRGGTDKLIELMHGGAVSTLEIPCILAEDMYDALKSARNRLRDAIVGGNRTSIGNAIFDMEALIVANCLFVDVLNPLAAFPGAPQFGQPNIQPPGNLAQPVLGVGMAGIIDTIENPCCCKLLVDLEWIAIKQGLIGQTPTLPVF